MAKERRGAFWPSTGRKTGLLAALRAGWTKRKVSPQPEPALLSLRNLNQWPTGARPYLAVTWPHCLLPHGTIRCERMRFGSMEHLLAHWAFLVFQSVEMATLCEADEDQTATARHLKDAEEGAELVHMIAADIGHRGSGKSEAEAAELVARSITTGRAIGMATKRGEHPCTADFYPWYEMP